MHQLVKNVLEKTNNSSGKSILESLVNIADIADEKFEVEMLDSFWEPFGGYYQRFIRDISANLGLNERPLYDPHEPFSAYNKQHSLQKLTLKKIFPHIQFVNGSLLNKISDDEDLMLVSYHIWYNFGSSSKYFSSDISKFDKFALKFKGLEEQEKVEEEISDILKPYQLNQSPLHILTSNPQDLFSYNNRLISLIQKNENYKENKGSFTDLIWSFGIYTSYPELIGYVLFNKDDAKKIFLPS